MVRGPVGMAIALVISLVVVAMMAGGGTRVFARFLPESAMAVIDNIAASGTFSSMDGPRKGADGADPMSYLRDSSDGWKANEDVATLPGGGLAFVPDVIDGWISRLHEPAPGAVEVLVEHQGCRFTPPSAAAVIGHVRAAATEKIGLATYNDTHIAAAVQLLADRYRKSGLVAESSLSAFTYEAFDIAVTETAAPVYLVIEAVQGLPVFNIHLAPGARIERVVILGGEQVGVANLDPAVPVEALRATGIANCGITPWYPLNPGALYYQSVENGAIKPEEVAVYEEKFARWDAEWEGFFRESFGVGAKETLSGNVANVRVATVGPVPATAEGRAVYRSVKGAALRVTVDQYVEYPGMGEGQDFDSVVKAVAKAFAWGDFANLAQGVQF